MRRINMLVISFCLIIFTSLFIGGQAMASEKKGQIIYRKAEQKAYKGPSEFFTGESLVEPLFPDNDVATYVGAYVTFQPSARSNWHKHIVGQHLVVIKGVCWTQTWDGQKSKAYPGDSIWCPADVKHWHGASPESEMTHLSLAHSDKVGQNTVWLEPVTDKQYNS